MCLQKWGCGIALSLSSPNKYFSFIDIFSLTEDLHLMTGDSAGHLCLIDFFCDMWRCEGLILAVLCMCLFTSTRVWSTACGPAWSFPLERWGMQALKRAPRNFSVCICAFLPLQKNFLLLFPGCCPLYLFLLVSTMSLPGSWSSWGYFQPTQCWAGSTEPGEKPSLEHSLGLQLSIPRLWLSVENVCCSFALLSLPVN